MAKQTAVAVASLYLYVMGITDIFVLSMRHMKFPGRSYRYTVLPPFGPS